MNYKSKKWLKKRASVLRRDGYMCKECKRYGLSREANTVHHIYPEEFYPEFAYESDNLVSLCSKCHNKMHDRDTHELTALGLKWCARVKDRLKWD